MPEIVLGVDPGTVHTGYAKIEKGEVGCKILEVGTAIFPSGLEAPSRINHIVNTIVVALGATPKAGTMWVELFVPYGGRRGSMWNTALAGALCYIPVTRQDKDLIAYGVYPIQWKEWVRTEVKGEKGEITVAMMEKLLRKYNVEYNTDVLADAHIRDAIGIALFGLYGAEDNYEYETGTALN